MAATKHAQQIKIDSQQYLTTALFQLLQTKSLNEIKVTDLIKRAGVSRMAYYRNYQDVSDILRQYFKPQIDRLFDDVLLGSPSEEKLAHLQHYFDTLSAQLILADHANFEYIIAQIFLENMQHYYEQTPTWSQLTPMQRRYWTTFMSHGVYAIWREWLVSGRSERLATIHDLIGSFQNATVQALRVK